MPSEDIEYRVDLVIDSETPSENRKTMATVRSIDIARNLLAIYFGSDVINIDSDIDPYRRVVQIVQLPSGRVIAESGMHMSYDVGP